MPQPSVRFEPIRPKKPITKVRRDRIVSELQNIQSGVINRMSKYPSQRPGSTYRRTGEYGRRWTRRGPRILGKDLVAEVGSNLEYAPYVGGSKSRRPGQARSSARAGWESIDEVGQEEFDKRKRAIIDAIEGR